MPRSQSTGATRKVYTLEESVWNWKILAEGEAFRKMLYTEEGYTRNGDEKIQTVTKVGDANQNIIVIETIAFNDASEWKRNEFLKSAGIYPGEGVPYNLTAEMCIGLGGKCRTKNKTKDGYTNTEINEYLEAPEQRPERIPGFLVSDEDGVKSKPEEPDYTDSIPF